MGLGVRQVKQAALRAMEAARSKAPTELAPAAKEAPAVGWTSTVRPGPRPGTREWRIAQQRQAAVEATIDPKHTWVDLKSRRVVFNQPPGVSSGQHVREVLEQRGPTQAAYFAERHGVEVRSLTRELRLRTLGTATYEPLGPFRKTAKGQPEFGLRLHQGPSLTPRRLAEVRELASTAHLTVCFERPPGLGRVFVSPSGRLSVEPRSVWDDAALKAVRAFAQKAGEAVQLAPPRSLRDGLASRFSLERFPLAVTPGRSGGGATISTVVHPGNVKEAARSLPAGIRMQLPFGELERNASTWFLHRAPGAARLDREAAQLSRDLGLTVRVVN